MPEHEIDLTGQVTGVTRSPAGYLLPKYKCHKEVRAMKIAEVKAIDGAGARLVSAEVGIAEIVVSSKYVAKHDPQAGGYFVVYEDGYWSYSPAKAFEAGYTRIEP